MRKNLPIASAAFIFHLLCASSQASSPVASDFSWAKMHGKSPTKFTAKDWRPIIDAVWGQGLPTAQKLQIFDRWWNEVDLQYGAFHNFAPDIFALRDHYRPEIEAGVSRGRFAAIMNHFTFKLNELHTWAYDIRVSFTTLRKGVPVLVVGQWGTNQHFGAVLTPLPDSSLLVYKSLPNHPLGLVPGDLVLGYDGVLWKDIYPTLLEAELPLALNIVNAATEEANTYYLLQSAGLNWHLFDTIDIVKYGTGDTLHFSTNLLANENRIMWGSEQIDVPGVKWPDRTNGRRVSWGVMTGTKVGYVYVTSWAADAQNTILVQFRNAVDSLMHHTETDGIIFDFRFNTGGTALARDGLVLLFNQTVATVGFDRRVRGEDHFAMQPDPQRPASALVIRGDPNTFYNKPIAILIGPGSISAGELEARRLAFHPRARIFGKAAAGGNTGSDNINLGNSDWSAMLATGPQYLVSTHEYLSHKALEPHEKVWFDRDDVARGEDTVVKAAMAWIAKQTTGVADEASGSLPTQFMLQQNYPNPFNPSTAITYQLPLNSEVKLAVYNIAGQLVRKLVDGERQSAGAHTITWDGKDESGKLAASGVYVYRLETVSRVDSQKMILLR
ncbi:T9SS type A sorting domain-containing protein [bacterium]|nr:T9SS type A sorting domain-containing protein [bacterium]